MTTQPNNQIIITPGSAFNYDPATNTYVIDTAQATKGIDFKLTIPTADGRTASYQIDFLMEHKSAAQPVVTTFAAEADLADLDFVFPTTSVNFKYIDNSGGFARLVTPRALPAHGSWKKAGGDGLYRALVRVGGAALTPAPDRRVGLGARIRHASDAFFGLRLDLFQQDGPRIALCDYTGQAGNIETISTGAAAWTFGSWNWLELKIAGDDVQGRIYPENDAAPAWQVSGKTKSTGTGGFGPGGVPALDAAPVLDIRRLEFVPA